MSLQFSRHLWLGYCGSVQKSILLMITRNYIAVLNRFTIIFMCKMLEQTLRTMQ